MRPFGFHVTILNTLDYLGKFDGKSDEGFFIGYSLNSKAFKVYNIRTRKVEESLHIRFLEDKPIIAGDGPKWLFDIDVLTNSMNYVPVVAGTNSNDLVDGSLFDSSLKNASNDEPQPSSDVGKKDDKGINKENRIDDQERPENSTQDVNTAGPSINTTSTIVNTGSLNINTVSPTFTTAPLEATYADFFGDETEIDMSNITTIYLVPSTPNTRIHKDHSLDHVIGDVQSGVQTRRMTKTTNEQGFISAVYEGKTHEDLHTCLFAYFLSQEEPKKVIQALKDPSWIEAMQEELLQFKLQQGYTQEEGIDYDEVFAPVSRIKAIRLFLAYASFKDFVVYQMDVKSAFLYGKIEEEVYVYQPPGFEDPEFIRVKSDILLVQVYVDDIIFGSTKKELCTKFEKLIHKKFQMSSMGELTFFLGLQVTQKDDGIFISQDKFVDEILKKFGFSTMKTASTPMETSKPLMKDENAEDVDVYLYRSVDIIFVDSSFNLEAYSDSDYADASLDRKSTTGGCQFLGSRLILWQCKKQTIVVTSTTEAEYLATASFYGQNGKGATTASSLEAEQASGNINKTQSMAMPYVPLPQEISAGGSPRCQEAIGGSIAQTRSERICAIYGESHHPSSCTKQFWATAKAKTVNGEVYIQALVDGKKMIVTETSERRKRFSRKLSPLYLRNNDVQAPEELEPIIDEAANEEHVPIHSNDPLLSGLKRLRKVGRTTRIESSKDEGLGAQEDASKQGRKIVDLDADAEKLLKDFKKNLQAGLEEEERMARQKEEEDNLILWDNTQAMMEADYELAQRLQVEEQGELTIEERSKLFVELMDKRKKHFAKLRAEEIRRKPPTKDQKEESN
ncbi:putative ribonuclease H-like domain-containing protein [Tanacetum coccineum]